MAGELKGVVQTQPGVVRQDLLIQPRARVLGKAGLLLVAQCPPPSLSSSTIISRVAASDHTGSGKQPPVVGFTA
jgi:hypothetical protein